MFLPLHDQNNESVKITPYVSYALMAVTILFFCYQMLLQLGDVNESVLFTLRHGLVPGPFLSGKAEYVCNLEGKVPSKRRKKFGVPPAEDPGTGNGGDFRVKVRNTPLGLLLMPVSYNFLHGGWMHLLGNLWFFWIFSDNVEERLGSLVFLVFYLGAGIAGGLLHALMHTDSTTPLVGASGAISGLMGAYIILFPGNRITTYFCPVWFYIRRIDVPSWMVLGFFILFNVFALSTASLSSRVAFDCHVGGFAAGIATAWLFRQRASSGTS